jgi:uncharacterized protein YjbI with pentapeptide repeats
MKGGTKPSFAKGEGKMTLTTEQLDELKGRYNERQLSALREKYSDEMIYSLWKRWEKPLLKPGSFTRDPETGEVTGGKPQPIDEKGNRYRGNCILNKSLNGINKIETFQDLLTTRILQIEEILPTENGKAFDPQNPDGSRFEIHEIWNIEADKSFKQTMKNLYLHGLNLCIGLTDDMSYDDDNLVLDLRGAELWRGVFIGADFENAHFEGAILDYANLYGANCNNAYFQGCDLENVYLYGADCEISHFEGSYCDHADFMHAYLVGSHFNRAYLEKACFESANCESAHFNNAYNLEASFNGAICSYAHFESAICCRSSLNIKELISENGEIMKIPCELSGVTFNNNSSFIGVDTSNVDWSKNPRLKRFIEQQQYVHAAKEGIDATFGKRKITKPIGWGIKKLISLVDYLSDPLNWVMYAVATILLFAVIHSFCFDAIKFANDVNWFTPIYFSVVTFSTLGFGDIAPLTWYSQLFAVIEVIAGYVFLGGLVTFLANWLGRR